MQPSSLNIFSLNIELDRHFDRIIPFLKEQQPEVILMQEVLSKDLPYLENALGMNGIFTPMSLYPSGPSQNQLGLCTFSRLPVIKKENHYYKGNRNNPHWLEYKGPLEMPRAIQMTEISKMDQTFSFINTHFTWTPDGKPSQQQHQDLEALFKSLDQFQEFILCGDFNAPRGSIIFDTLANKYKDNIPPNINTTIDKRWHKAGDLNLVVDGLFTTPKYQVKTIAIIDNLSDHCGILANVSFA